MAGVSGSTLNCDLHNVAELASEGDTASGKNCEYCRRACGKAVRRTRTAFEGWTRKRGHAKWIS